MPALRDRREVVARGYDQVAERHPAWARSVREAAGICSSGGACRAERTIVISGLGPLGSRAEQASKAVFFDLYETLVTHLTLFVPPPYR